MKVLILVDDYEQLHEVINVEHNIGNLYYRDDGMPYTKDQFLLIDDIEEMVALNKMQTEVTWDNVQLRKQLKESIQDLLTLKAIELADKNNYEYEYDEDNDIWLIYSLDDAYENILDWYASELEQEGK